MSFKGEGNEVDKFKKQFNEEKRIEANAANMQLQNKINMIPLFDLLLFFIKEIKFNG